MEIERSDRDKKTQSIYEILEEIDEIVDILSMKTGHSIDLAIQRLATLRYSLGNELGRRVTFETYVTEELLKQK